MSADDRQTPPRSLREQVRGARLRFADSAVDLGTLLRLLGEYTEAERLLRQAVEIYEADRRTPPEDEDEDEHEHEHEHVEESTRTPQELS
ncbi:tetratricopeptide repeat protein [Streptomyces sp. CA-249302]|uniref:tetratricopeptide repeat protein n=1 Tax=Streptomyces sp. CA-249302 TaxID=3240058 RepID=UPI003D940F10